MPRRVLFTLHNPDQTDMSLLLGFTSHDQFRFLCYQGEYTKTGIPHLQGYLEITKNQRLSWFKNQVSEKAHFEGANGSSEKNIHYCSKPCIIEGTTPCGCDHCVEARAGTPNWLAYQSFGQPATDILGNGMWESVQNMVVAGASNKMITETLPAIIPHLSKVDQFRKMREYAEKANYDVKNPQYENRKIRGIWLYGDSSTGKSKSVRDLHPKIYSMAEKNIFDDYAGEKEVLWDDFDPKRCSFKTLLRYLDVYPVLLTCRYQNQWARYNDFFFTHISNPALIYHKKYTQEELIQLLRRVEVVKVIVTCSLCNSEAQFVDYNWTCGMHGKTGAMQRKFRYKGKSYDSLKEVLDIIPYRS